MKKWIRTGSITLDSARELLAAADRQPIHLRVSRKDRGTKAGGWDPPSYLTTCTLLGVTNKRLKVKEAHGGMILYPDPKQCYLAELKEIQGA